MTKEVFKFLFDTHFNAVRSYLFYRGAEREAATDLAQDVFMRIWEKQMDIDRKGALKLLFKIAGDMFISRYRREKLELTYIESLTYDNFERSPEDHLRYNELKSNFSKAMTKLSEKQRTVFLMARMEGLKYHEIAERLNISVKAVEKRMHISLEYLRKVLH